MIFLPHECLDVVKLMHYEVREIGIIINITPVLTMKDQSWFLGPVEIGGKRAAGALGSDSLEGRRAGDFWFLYGERWEEDD